MAGPRPASAPFTQMRYLVSALILIHALVGASGKDTDFRKSAAPPGAVGVPSRHAKMLTSQR